MDEAWNLEALKYKLIKIGNNAYKGEHTSQDDQSIEEFKQIQKDVKDSLQYLQNINSIKVSKK